MAKDKSYWDNKGVRRYVLDPDDVQDLEREAGVHEFINGKPREQAEDDAYSDYKRKHHLEAAAHHLMMMRAAQANGNYDDAKQHKMIYDMHIRELGFDDNGEVPDEVQQFMSNENAPRPIKYKPHKADSFFDAGSSTQSADSGRLVSKNEIRQELHKVLKNVLRKATATGPQTYAFPAEPRSATGPQTLSLPAEKQAHAPPPPKPVDEITGPQTYAPPTQEAKRNLPMPPLPWGERIYEASEAGRKLKKIFTRVWQARQYAASKRIPNEGSGLPRDVLEGNWDHLSDDEFNEKLADFWVKNPDFHTDDDDPKNPITPEKIKRRKRWHLAIQKAKAEDGPRPPGYPLPDGVYNNGKWDHLSDDEFVNKLIGYWDYEQKNPLLPKVFNSKEELKRDTLMRKAANRFRDENPNDDLINENDPERRLPPGVMDGGVWDHLSDEEFINKLLDYWRAGKNTTQKHEAKEETMIPLSKHEIGHELYKTLVSIVEKLDKSENAAADIELRQMGTAAHLGTMSGEAARRRDLRRSESFGDQAWNEMLKSLSDEELEALKKGLGEHWNGWIKTAAAAVGTTALMAGAGGVAGHYGMKAINAIAHKAGLQNTSEPSDPHLGAVVGAAPSAALGLVTSLSGDRPIQTAGEVARNAGAGLVAAGTGIGGALKRLRDRLKRAEISEKDIEEGSKIEEKEHELGEETSAKIARDHLEKDPHYYDHEKSEKKPKKPYMGRDSGIVRGRLAPGTPGADKYGGGVQEDRKKKANKEAARQWKHKKEE